jgi:ubiquinone/menaquinone biosynthesis C-methylase UbiE
MATEHLWWLDFFDDFRPIFDTFPKRISNQQAAFIIRKMGLRKGKTFLDCPCGIGRISLPLARKGIRVTGVDITESYLEELEEKAKRAKLKIETQHCDMRRITFSNQFDAAGNLLTSFGYFEKEADNLRTLRCIYYALKPGGKFVLHVTNRDWILVNYTPRGWQEIKSLKVLEKREFDYSRSVNRAVWHFIRDGKKSSYSVMIRLYSYHELIAMLKKVGFENVEGYGDPKESPISRDTRMMWIFATKPRSVSRKRRR